MDKHNRKKLITICPGRTVRQLINVEYCQCLVIKKKIINRIKSGAKENSALTIKRDTNDRNTKNTTE